jgi:hypothetical protein
MWGIPEWAIGVGFIIVAISLASSFGRRFGGRLVDSDRLRGGKASRRELGETLDDVQRRLGDLEDAQRRLGEAPDVQSRLSEIEERLDFAERLLAKQRDGERISPPKS